MKEKKCPDHGTMQEAYDHFRDLVVDHGVPFRVDLAKKNMTVGSTKIVEDGKFFGTVSDLDLVNGDVMRTLDDLYAVYKRSVPGERDCRRERNGSQFHAVPFDELTDDDVLYNARRNEARYDLEAFVLFAILNGQLKWNDEWGTWFYKSPKDRDLVLLKDWFRPVENNKNNETNETSKEK